MASSPEDRRRVGFRLTVLQSIITVLFSILAVSFWVLQVVQHEKFLEMAENNHQRTLALRAPRGMVFDRNGELLVRNRQAYSISIDREHTTDLNRTVRLVSSVLRDLGVLQAHAEDSTLAHSDLEPALQRLLPAFEGDRAVRAFSAVEKALDALDRNASPKIVADWLAFQV